MPLKPLGLLMAEIARPASVEIDYVDEADEVHAVGVEAVPARALGAATVAVAVELYVLIVDIVLAWHVMHVEPRLRNDAIDVVEFGWLLVKDDVVGDTDYSVYLRIRLNLIYLIL